MFAVIGNPVYHSITPEIYRHFGLTATRISPDSEEDMFHILKNLNLSGFNITSPYKKCISDIIEKKDEIVKTYGLCNFILSKDNTYLGFNTDYYALNQIFNNNYNKQKIFIIGAGSIAELLINFFDRNNNTEIFIFNRTISKINNLTGKKIFTVQNNEINYYLKKADFIINTIPYLDEKIKKIFHNNIGSKIIYDIIYHNSPFKEFKSLKNIGKKWFYLQAKKNLEIITGQNIDISNLHLKRKNENMNFIFSGYAGSGKTSIGKLVAENLGFNFIDTDKLIEKKLKLSIKEIFINYTEDYFRKIESIVINNLNKVQNTIISIGGGTLLDNQKILNQIGEIIYLYCDFDICMNRIKNSDRPLIDKYNREHYNIRKDLYTKTSDLIVNSNFPITKTANRIINEINNTFGN